MRRSCVTHPTLTKSDFEKASPTDAVQFGTFSCVMDMTASRVHRYDPTHRAALGIRWNRLHDLDSAKNGASTLP
jgi:hypothetical protein